MPTERPKAPTKIDLANLPMPRKVVLAIADFSSVIGLSVSTLDETEAGWLSRDTGGSFTSLVWSDAAIRARFAPLSFEEWDLVYRMIGYCAFHGIAWRVVGGTEESPSAVVSSDG
ncbi:hypothetical protein [Azospirillum sp. sgz302134]